MPALHIGGWYDIFTADTLRDFVGIRKHGGNEQARAHQRLLIGPWLHGPLEGLVGEVDFGLLASSLLVLPEEIQLRWFDYWLKGEENGIVSFQKPGFSASVFVSPLTSAFPYRLSCRLGGATLRRMISRSMR